VAVEGIRLSLSTVLGSEGTLGRGPNAPDVLVAERPCLVGGEWTVPKNEIDLNVGRFKLAVFTLS
jgi:hypothetical protein